MGLLTPLAVRVGSWEFMPKLLPQITATDKKLQQLTRGKVSILDVAGLPNVRLRVRGRKTGEWRETPLLAVPRGQAWLVAGSNFGGPKQPVWVVNLDANPDAEVVVKGRTSLVMGRRLEGHEREAAWAHMVRTWPNYNRYAERTDREITVFELVPRTG